MDANEYISGRLNDMVGFDSEIYMILTIWYDTQNNTHISTHVENKSHWAEGYVEKQLQKNWKYVKEVKSRKVHKKYQVGRENGEHGTIIIEEFTLSSLLMRLYTANSIQWHNIEILNKVIFDK